MSQRAIATALLHPRPLGLHRDTPGWASRGVPPPEAVWGGALQRVLGALKGGQGGSTFQQREWNCQALRGDGARSGDPGESQEGAPSGHGQSLVPGGQCPMGVSGPTSSSCQRSLARGLHVWGLPESWPHTRGAGIQGRERPRTFWFDSVLPAGRPPWGPGATASHLPLWGGVGEGLGQIPLPISA